MRVGQPTTKVTRAETTTATTTTPSTTTTAQTAKTTTTTPAAPTTHVKEFVMTQATTTLPALPKGAPLHTKARTERPAGYPVRAVVDDAHVAWRVPLPGYAPPDFTDPKVFTASWAEPADVTLKKAFPSTVGAIVVDGRGRPLNPMGRTGVEGRGLLGKWGANPAGDPIVTRVDPQSGAVELLAIQRKDSGQWALPGGMVDDGEDIFNTVARELFEETGVVLDFSDAAHVYAGYVDDRRNTDNAWMETTVKHKHLSADDAARLVPKGQDDAMDATWLRLTPENVGSLYASHGAFVKTALKALLKDPSLAAPTRAHLRSLVVGA